MSNLKLCIGVFIYLLTTNALALTCPNYHRVKGIKFTTAKQHPRDPDLWYVFSDSFEYNKQNWSISFAKFFYTETLTSAEVLLKAQEFFNTAPFKIPSPKVIWIPSGAFCDYMTEGSEYLVSAVSPPQFEIAY